MNSKRARISKSEFEGKTPDLASNLAVLFCNSCLEGKRLFGERGVKLTLPVEHRVIWIWRETTNQPTPNAKSREEKRRKHMNKLREYSSCDISDALCALGIFGGISNIIAMANGKRISGPAYTCEFVMATALMGNPSIHHVDTCPKGSVLVIKAPKEAPNAVWGGLMTARAIAIGCVGAVVEGRVRDINEIQEMGFPVWATGQSTMGASPFCKVGSVAEPIRIASESSWPVMIRTGDFIVADSDGAVRIPQDRIEDIAAYCAKRVMEDKLVMEDVRKGISLVEAFAKHRK